MSGLFQWESVPEGTADAMPDPVRRRRVRTLVAACVVGTVVIAVLAVLGTVVLVGELDKRDRPKGDVIRQEYSRRYDQCRDAGGAAGRCASQASRACVADARWRDSDPAEELVRACDFTRATR